MKVLMYWDMVEGMGTALEHEMEDERVRLQVLHQLQLQHHLVGESLKVQRLTWIHKRG